MRPQSAKRVGNLRPLNKYRQAKTPEEYLNQRFTIDLDTDCWNFTGGKDKDGYGQCHDSKVAKDLGVTRAHQMAWVIKNGPIPTGMFVCHTCDNPSCVNPLHLFLGTPNDNVQDMMQKDRYIHPTTLGKGYKLTEEERKQIMMLRGKESGIKVASKYNVSFSRIYQMWRSNAA